MSQDYNSTLNLPETEFPMRGNLPKREPEMLAEWEKKDVYHNMLRKNVGKPKFVLHDGPPYANGDIHLGTALNKVLKDIIVRYKNMSGFNYVTINYDCGFFKIDGINCGIFNYTISAVKNATFFYSRKKWFFFLFLSQKTLDINI